MLYNKKIFERVFCFKGKYWYRNISQIPYYLRCIHRLIKYGYDEMAHWETFGWFIDSMRDILTHYRKHHMSYPLGVTCEEWEAKVDKMISLLNDMDECNPKYETEEYQKDFHGNKLRDQLKIDDAMMEAKDEFFKLFAEHFYSLWD